MLSAFKLESTGRMGVVIIQAHDDGLTVRAETSWATIDNAIGRTNLSKGHRILVVESNLDLLGRIASAKYARREFETKTIHSTTYAHIAISSEDIERSGLRLSSSALDPREE